MNKQSYFEKNPKKTIFFLLAFIFIVISISIETYLRIVKGDISLTEIKYDDIDGIRKYKKIINSV